MYAKIAALLFVAATAAACAQNEQLACREVPTEIQIKGPGCALIVAESEGKEPGRPAPRPGPRDLPDDPPDDPPGDTPNDNPTGGPAGVAPQ